MNFLDETLNEIILEDIWGTKTGWKKELEKSEFEPVSEYNFSQERTMYFSLAEFVLERTYCPIFRACWTDLNVFRKSNDADGLSPVDTTQLRRRRTELRGLVPERLSRDSTGGTVPGSSILVVVPLSSFCSESDEDSGCTRMA